jgi:DNA polymerase-3 subunit chi
MTRVDFFVLSEGASPLRFACDMAVRLRAEQLNVHIQADSQADAVALDALLWTFRDISFLPHALADTRAPDPVPILIGWPGQSPATDEVLINLSRELPDFAGAFRRIIEPVATSAEAKAESRARYRQYRERGWELSSQKMDQDQNHANL